MATETSTQEEDRRKQEKLKKMKNSSRKKSTPILELANNYRALQQTEEESNDEEEMVETIEERDQHIERTLQRSKKNKFTAKEVTKKGITIIKVLSKSTLISMKISGNMIHQLQAE